MRDWINLFESADLKANSAFNKWFGTSKVLNENGEPLVVYHGGTKWRVLPGVTWFTDDPAVADGYADQGYGDPEIKACFLRIENPLDLRNPEVIKEVFPQGTSEFVHPAYHDRDAKFALRVSREAVGFALDYATKNGFDGMIHPDTNVSNRGEHTAYVVFHANQVKAAEFEGWEDDLIYGAHSRFSGNKGNYSSDHDDITESDNQIDPMKSFVFQKWKERAAERSETEPHDLSQACKFAAAFVHGLTGGEIKANEFHTWVEDGGRIIDLCSEASDVAEMKAGRIPGYAKDYAKQYGLSLPDDVYEEDEDFIESGDFKEAMQSIKPRVDKWIEEYKSA